MSERAPSSVRSVRIWFRFCTFVLTAGCLSKIVVLYCSTHKPPAARGEGECERAGLEHGHERVRDGGGVRRCRVLHESIIKTLYLCRFEDIVGGITFTRGIVRAKIGSLRVGRSLEMDRAPTNGGHGHNM